MQTGQEESMFVDAMKKGHGIAWELDLPFRAFGVRQTVKVCSKLFLKRHLAVKTNFCI